MWMRIGFGVFVLAHGLGHGIWAQAALSGRPLKGAGGRMSFPGGPQGRTARTLGLVSLAALAAFGVSAAGVFLAASWWWAPAAVGLVVSLLVVLAWWNPVGTVSLNALLADGFILAVMAIPWLSSQVDLP